MVSKDTYDFEAKRAYRQAWADFIKKHYPSERERRNLNVLCLPGHEGFEVTEVYLPLGFKRQNIWGIERDKEALSLLSGLDLGINIVEGEMLDFLKSTDPDLKFDIANFDFTGRASAFSTASPIMAFFERNRLSQFRRTLLGTTFWAGMERIPEQRKLVLAAVQYYVLSKMVLNRQFFDPSSLLDQIGKVLPGVFTDPETGNTYLQCNKAEKWAIHSFLFSPERDLPPKGQLSEFYRLDLQESMPDARLPFSELRDIRDVGITWLVLACAHLPKDSWALHELNNVYGQKCDWDKSDKCRDECRFMKKAFATISNLKSLLLGTNARIFGNIIPGFDIDGPLLLHHAKATGMRFIEDIERYQYINDKGHKLLVDFFAFDPKREWFRGKYDISIMDAYMKTMEGQLDSLMDSSSVSTMNSCVEVMLSLSRKQAVRIGKQMKSAARLTSDPKNGFARKLIPEIPQRMDIIQPEKQQTTAVNQPPSDDHPESIPDKTENHAPIQPEIIEEVKFWIVNGEKPEEILRAYPNLSKQQLIEIHSMAAKDGVFAYIGKVLKKTNGSSGPKPTQKKRRKSR